MVGQCLVFVFGVFFKSDAFAKAYRIRFYNYGNISWYAVLFGNANEMIDIVPG